MRGRAWFASANYTGRPEPFRLRIRKKNTGLRPLDRDGRGLDTIAG